MTIERTGPPATIQEKRERSAKRRGRANREKREWALHQNPEKYPGAKVATRLQMRKARSLADSLQGPLTGTKT